jgi:hypothetical protein
MGRDLPILSSNLTYQLQIRPDRRAAGRLLGPRRGALAAEIAIGTYAPLLGATPSVVRYALIDSARWMLWQRWQATHCCAPTGWVELATHGGRCGVR